MADEQQLEILQQGVDTWNKWRQENPSIRPDLSGADLSGRRLNKINFRGVVLYEANLRGTVIRDADLREATLNQACLHEATLSRSNLTKAWLWKADLCDAHLSRAILCSASLCLANLRNVHFSDANLTETDFQGADLRGARLGWTDCTRTNFGGANLEEVNFDHAYFDSATITSANLQRADLSYAYFFFTSLFKSNLRGANLSGAIFRYGDLNFSDLSRAIMEGTMFSGTQLWMTNLKDTTIYRMAVSYPLAVKEAIETDLVITKDNEPTVVVDNLDIAQYLSLHLRTPMVRTAKLVLITGHFSAERDGVLKVIREGLREHGYIPVFFDHKSSSSTHNWTEMLETLVHLVRFIIVDMTASHDILDKIINIIYSCKTPIQPLIEISSSTNQMQATLTAMELEYRWLLPAFPYQDIDSLRSLFKSHVIIPAERSLASPD